jgi:hypothetical protein
MIKKNYYRDWIPVNPGQSSSKEERISPLPNPKVLTEQDDPRYPLIQSSTLYNKLTHSRVTNFPSKWASYNLGV